MRYKNSTREKLLNYINALPNNVILRKDINLPASSRQISRALDDLIKDKNFDTTTSLLEREEG